MKLQTFRGHCIGVKLRPRAAKDPHILLSLEIEDDEAWHEKDFSISSHWLDELIEQLQAARAYCVAQEADIVKAAPGFPPNTQFGWKFKS